MAGLFGREWDRFRDGTRQLSGEEYERLRAIQNRNAKRPDESYSINVPGWDDVVRVGPRYRPTRAELDEHYRARRQGGQANISQEARDSIAGYQRWKDAARTSAQDQWSQGWGQILTAIDNVQDFASSMATFGRLGLWAGPRAAGLLEGVLGLQGLLTGGLAARLGGRLVPILGGIILAGDVLNLAALLGTLGMFGFGVLCKGPSAALAAGAPTLLFKRALKNELWNAARRNPFGRAARVAARGRAVGKLPGIGNLLEVAQTTESLWGYGVSFGGVVGFMMETTMSAEKLLRGDSVTVQTDGAAASWRRLYGKLAGQLSRAELEETSRAARVVTAAPVILSGQDPFDEELHLVALAAYLGALPLVLRLLDQAPWEDTLDEVLAVPRAPFIAPGPIFERMIVEDDDDLATGARWALPGSPATLTGYEYIEATAGAVAAATRRFIEKRGDGLPALLYGTMVGQGTETLWRHTTRDPEGLRWELSPAFKILSDMIEDGWLIAETEETAAFHAWWRFMLAQHRERDRRRIPPEIYTRRAAQLGVRLLKMLPPSAGFPVEWAADEPAIARDVSAEPSPAPPPPPRDVGGGPGAGAVIPGRIKPPDREVFEAPP